MNKHPQPAPKKPTGSMLRIVLILSFLLLLVRLIWVLPVALHHHQSKKPQRHPSAKAGRLIRLNYQLKVAQTIFPDTACWWGYYSGTAPGISPHRHGIC